MNSRGFPAPDLFEKNADHSGAGKRRLFTGMMSFFMSWPFSATA